MDYRCNIPVAVFMFKRGDKTATIIDRIAQVAPPKIYLIADGARNPEEEEAVARCREQVEQHITWDCEVIKNYAEVNRGVYANIAGGAKWVLERETEAIFLEDDNLPEISFFRFCEDLLKKYRNDGRILWICGTNYLEQYRPEDGSSYVFTQHMLPCGWASWSDKFLKYYDGDLSLLKNAHIRQNISSRFQDQRLYRQNLRNWEGELQRIERGAKPVSWDYQMAFSLRVHNLYGIAPCYNQIRNIGADEDSVHGGMSLKMEMTNRFCERKTHVMEFPLKDPAALFIDKTFEAKTSDIIVLPWKLRFRGWANRTIKNILHIPQERSLTKWRRK